MDPPILHKMICTHPTAPAGDKSFVDIARLLLFALRILFPFANELERVLLHPAPISAMLVYVLQFFTLSESLGAILSSNANQMSYRLVHPRSKGSHHSMTMTRCSYQLRGGWACGIQQCEGPISCLSPLYLRARSQNQQGSCGNTPAAAPQLQPAACRNLTPSVWVDLIPGPP